MGTILGCPNGLGNCAGLMLLFVCMPAPIALKSSPPIEPNPIIPPDWDWLMAGVAAGAVRPNPSKDIEAGRDGIELVIAFPAGKRERMFATEAR